QIGLITIFNDGFTPKSVTVAGRSQNFDGNYRYWTYYFYYSPSGRQFTTLWGCRSLQSLYNDVGRLRMDPVHIRSPFGISISGARRSWNINLDEAREGQAGIL